MTRTTTLSAIDFPAVAARAGDLRDMVARDLGDPGRSGKYHCPFHSGGRERSPSLHVWDDHFHCFACGEEGDAIDWVSKLDNLSLVAAAKAIDPTIVTADDLKAGHTAPARPRPATPRPTPPRPARPGAWEDPEWQDRLDRLVIEAGRTLWSADGREALDWLRARGLLDHTIRRFRLGFIPRDTRTGPVGCLLDDDGRPRGIFAPRGIVIPWLAPGAWYSRNDGRPPGPRWVGMNVRRLAADVDGPLPEGFPKCLAVKGSIRGYLYPYPTIEPTQGSLPLLLVEGEFDALIGQQEAGHFTHVGSVGSASVLNLPRETVVAIASCPWLLLALDMDRAGAEASWAWLRKYPHKARRMILPVGKDLNAFVAAGGNVVDWLKSY